MYLAEQGFEVYGIDIAEKGVKKAKQKLHDLKTCAALTTGSIFHVLPYETDFFDGSSVLKCCITGGLKTFGKRLKKWNALKPKGFISVSVRNPASNRKRLCGMIPEFMWERKVFHITRLPDHC